MGIIIPVFSLKTLTFAATTTIAPLVRVIDVRQWRELTLLLRVFSNSNGSGSSITIRVRACAPSEEGPDVDFVDATNLASLVISDSGTTPAGTLIRGVVTANFGGWVQILVEATKGANPCAAAVNADFSAKE
jgi:hypothetical protein